MECLRGRGWQVQKGESLRSKAQSWEVERVASGDLDGVRRLLSESKLPVDGLDETELWRVRKSSRGAVIGIAGLETWGRQGLVRSVVVDDSHRRSGVGRALVERVFEEARVRHLLELYLITETAPLFFERLGFEPLERRKVKDAVLDSVEFRGACPDTAPVMRLDLEKAAPSGPQKDESATASSAYDRSSVSRLPDIRLAKRTVRASDQEPGKRRLRE